MKKSAILSVLFASCFFILSLVLTPSVHADLTTDYTNCVAQNGCEAMTGTAQTTCNKACQDFAYSNNGSPELAGGEGTVDQQTMPQYIHAVEQCRDGEGNFQCTIGAGVTSLMLSVSDSSTNASKGKLAGKGGAIGFFANSVTTLLTKPPVTGGKYVAYMTSRVKIPGSPTTAYADDSNGIGFTKLEPIIAVWTIARNLAYLLFAIIFVVIGFMIIFRVKIDPKTVATLQNALPKVFVALLLITFSYAIAGFLIDIMYLLIGLSISLFKTTDLLKDPKLTGVSKAIAEQTIFGVFNVDGNFFDVAGSSSAAIGNIVSSFFDKTIAGNGFNGFLGVATSAIAWFVITLAILYSLFKTWLSLLGAYIQIIIGVIVSPLFLMMEAIPGQSTFGKWLRMMLSNILVFPFVVIMILLGYHLTNDWSTSAGVTGFVPPLIGGNNPDAVKALIGLGLILSMPKAINILQEFFKAPPFKYGNAWQEPLKEFGVPGAQKLGGFGYRNLGGQTVASNAARLGRAVWRSAHGP